MLIDPAVLSNGPDLKEAPVSRPSALTISGSDGPQLRTGRTILAILVTFLQQSRGYSQITHPAIQETINRGGNFGQSDFFLFHSSVYAGISHHSKQRQPTRASRRYLRDRFVLVTTQLPRKQYFSTASCRLC